jgi:hypothetical protein
VNGAGTVLLTATQPGNESYNEAHASQAFTVIPFALRAEYLNANGSNVTSNSIRPYLKIVNSDSIGIAYKELTARYWFTAENYAGVNTWIDYAVLGNKVKAGYVALPHPAAGAFWYIEYRFDSSAGVLTAGGNSGVIQSRAANGNWANFNEVDDHSHAGSIIYAPNTHLTLYRNGKLVWGTEPAGVAEQLQLTAVSQSKQSNANSISAVLNLLNQGNVPVDYEDVKVRYWFTAEGSLPVNHWVDYAQVGSTNVIGAVTRLSTPRLGADAYLEFGFKPAAGQLYPLANSSLIQFRMTKSDWSAFDQLNDHSYTLPAPLAENQQITVYYKGQLVYGIEPTEALLTGGAGTTSPAEQQQEAAAASIRLYPNPVVNNLVIQLGQVKTGAHVKVFNIAGALVAVASLNRSTQVLPLQHLAAGVYQVVINNGNQVTSKKIIKE